MKLSIVIPVYNGAKSIERLVSEILKDLGRYVELEIILVNDGSMDDSWQKLIELNASYPGTVTAVNLARNFGEHNAVMAGYHHCTGQYIVNIDDDFQNPPREILKLTDKIKEGYDVVYGYYAEKKHGFFRNLGSSITDKVANIMLKKPNDLYLCSFRIISDRLLNELVQYVGPYPYIDGLILRATANISTMRVEHQTRKEGRSGYTLIKLFRLWSHVFFNFSIIPLRISTGMGFLFSIGGFLMTGAVIIEKILNRHLQIGWASLMTIVLTLSGIQLIVVGLIGEYVGRIYLSQNRTPQFVVQNVVERDLSASDGNP